MKPFIPPCIFTNYRAIYELRHFRLYGISKSCPFSDDEIRATMKRHGDEPTWGKSLQPALVAATVEAMLPDIT